MCNMNMLFFSFWAFFFCVVNLNAFITFVLPPIPFPPLLRGGDRDFTGFFSTPLDDGHSLPPSSFDDGDSLPLCTLAMPSPFLTMPSRCGPAKIPSRDQCRLHPHPHVDRPQCLHRRNARPDRRFGQVFRVKAHTGNLFPEAARAIDLPVATRNPRLRDGMNRPIGSIACGTCQSSPIPRILG